MTSIHGHSPAYGSPAARKGKESEGAKKAAGPKKASAPKRAGRSGAPTRKESLFFRKLVEARKLKKMAQRKARRRRRRRKKKPFQEAAPDAAS